MKHKLVYVRIKTESPGWQDKLAGWHEWSITTRCPVTGKTITEHYHGTREKCVKHALQHPDCPCQAMK